MGNCFLLSKREGHRFIKEVEFINRINSDESLQFKNSKPRGHSYCVHDKGKDTLIVGICFESWNIDFVRLHPINYGSTCLN